jgi:hypothetical protein
MTDTELSDLAERRYAAKLALDRSSMRNSVNLTPRALVEHDVEHEILRRKYEDIDREYYQAIKVVAAGRLAEERQQICPTLEKP